MAQELADVAPNTLNAILDNLPIEVNINKWGKELYTDKTSIRAREENAKSEVNLLDVAFWPEGSALCLFYGPTPISKPDKHEYREVKTYFITIHNLVPVTTATLWLDVILFVLKTNSYILIERKIVPAR